MEEVNLKDAAFRSNPPAEAAGQAAAGRGREGRQFQGRRSARWWAG
jgi:hypothetical protein